MPELCVRPIRREELAQLLALYAQLHPDDPVLSPERVQPLWDRIAADPDLVYVGGDLGGRLVSSCTLSIVPNLTRGARPYGLIENVITHQAYRNRGFGSEVLRYALRVAWARDCYKVMLLTGSEREETLRFYEQAGFERGVKTGFVAYPQRDGH